MADEELPTGWEKRLSRSTGTSKSMIFAIWRTASSPNRESRRGSRVAAPRPRFILAGAILRVSRRMAFRRRFADTDQFAAVEGAAFDTRTQNPFIASSYFDRSRREFLDDERSSEALGMVVGDDRSHFVQDSAGK